MSHLVPSVCGGLVEEEVSFEGEVIGGEDRIWDPLLLGGLRERGELEHALRRHARAAEPDVVSRVTEV